MNADQAKSRLDALVRELGSLSQKKAKLAALIIFLTASSTFEDREVKDLLLLAANYTFYLVLYLENSLVPHIFLSHVRKGSRNIIVGLGFVYSPCPSSPNSYD